MDALSTGTKKSLVVGMGIGSLYQSVLTELDHQVYTVDVNPAVNANYSSVEAALADLGWVDLAFVCTPNYTHEPIARQLATHAGIIFIEKPGFKTQDYWLNFANDYPLQKFLMVKNNQWRDDFDQLQKMAKISHRIDINWINQDRIPKPGSWFTDKKKAWGGVSRDLMPHLLSIFIELNPAFQESCKILKRTYRQRWNLSDIESSDYGEVDANGVYNVDDIAGLHLLVTNKYVNIRCDWRSTDSDNVGIDFHTNKGVFTYKLGLCPENAYKNMILDCIENYDNFQFWEKHLRQDLWIHRIIQQFG